MSIFQEPSFMHLFGFADFKDCPIDDSVFRKVPSTQPTYKNVKFECYVILSEEDALRVGPWFYNDALLEPVDFAEFEIPDVDDSIIYRDGVINFDRAVEIYQNEKLLFCEPDEAYYNCLSNGKVLEAETRFARRVLSISALVDDELVTVLWTLPKNFVRMEATWRRFTYSRLFLMDAFEAYIPPLQGPLCSARTLREIPYFAIGSPKYKAALNEGNIAGVIASWNEFVGHFNDSLARARSIEEHDLDPVYAKYPRSPKGIHGLSWRNLLALRGQNLFMRMAYLAQKVAIFCDLKSERDGYYFPKGKRPPPDGSDPHSKPFESGFYPTLVSYPARFFQRLADRFDTIAVSRFWDRIG